MSRLLQYITEDEATQLVAWGRTFGKNHGIMPDEKGFFEMCVKHMNPKMGDADAYCARVKDAYHGSTMWRSGSGTPKTKAQVEKDVKANQNYPEDKNRRI